MCLYALWQVLSAAKARAFPTQFKARSAWLIYSALAIGCLCFTVT